jgi:hypothetical protein
MIPDFTVSTFRGLNTFIADLKTLKPGVASSSNNWITGKYGDHIELRRGSQLLGQTRQTGAGKITGLGVGTKKDGSQIPFFTYGKKAKYYDPVTDDMIEISSDLLGTAADGEDAWIAPYTHLAGYFVYLGSPNSGIWKVPLSNPGSAVSQQATSRFGFLRFGQGRAFAGRLRSSTGTNRDDTSMLLSYIDKSNYTDYTAVTGEAVGALGSTTYSGTLSAITGKRTAFLVVIAEAGGETLIDNGDGTLTGSQGSSGTINYATGAYSVTFNHTTNGAVTGDYRWGGFDFWASEE